MPIFQDPDRQRFYDLWSDDHSPEHEHGRQERQQAREDRSRDATASWNVFDHAGYGCETAGQNARELDYSRTSGPPLSKLHTGDREELIQYLKSVEASRWIRDHPV